MRQLTFPTRIGVALVVLELVVMYGLVVAPGRAKVASLRARAATLDALAERRRSLTAHLTELARARDAARREIARFNVGQVLGPDAALVRVVRTSANAHRVSVQRIEPQTTSIGADAGSERITIAFVGSYRDVLATIATLPSTGLPMKVGDVTLSAQPSAPPAPPAIVATVEARVYRDALVVGKEVPHVTDARP